MRRWLLGSLFPLLLCLIPAMAAGLVAGAIPGQARDYFLDHLSLLDQLICWLGIVLFIAQTLLSWRALQWVGTGFDETADPWLSHLAQAAEWFPLLGLLGTVAGILQTFGSISGPTPPERIIQLYAPAITATGAGLFMALVNILPTWMVLVGRDFIRMVAGLKPDDGGRT
jgi:MotA/TolQ/ExbB proton channel family